MKKRWLAAMLGCALFWQQCGSMALASGVTEPAVIQQELAEGEEEKEPQQEEIQEVEFSEEDSEEGEALEEKVGDESQKTISKENASVVETGNCGESATYTLDEDGTLVISGTGIIEDNVFQNNADIRNVIIKQGITQIGHYSFASCNNLEKIIVPESVKYVQYNSFEGCEQLRTAGGLGSECNIEFETGEKLSVAGKRGLFEYCADIKIPEGVVSIEDNYEFQKLNRLEYVSLPDSLRKIGKGAFWNCSNLQKIVIGKNIETINSWAFSGCASLSKVIILSDKVNIGRDVFSGCELLKTAGGIGENCNVEFALRKTLSGISGVLEYCETLIVPEGVVKLGEDFLPGNSDKAKIKAIVLPSTLTEIGSGAFWRCSSLKNVVLPESVTTIGSRAFGYCTSLESITIPDSVITMGGSVFSNCTSLKSIFLPDSMEIIPSDSFSKCESLTKITIPDSVRNIEGVAFSNCTGLQELTLPEGVQEVADNAFSGCTSLTRVSIESEQVSLGANAFQGCTSLKSVNSAGKLSLGDSAFGGCTELETFDCKGGVTAVGAEAFYNCGKLRAITLAEPLSEIRGHAFNGCSSLTEITLPKTVTQIRTYAFQGCKSLKDIYILNGNCKIYSNANTISETAVIHGQAISTAKEYASQYKRKFVALSDDNTGENNGKDDPKADMPEPEKKGDLYDDVPETSGWRYEAIKYVKDHGIMNGISGTRNFAPDEPLTRAMFATIIYRMEGSPKESYSAKFPDVPDGNYFSVPIIWANKAGIINGHSNTGLFGTRENITREDMVVIMYRYCKVKGLASGDRADLGRFPDADQISGYAKEAVQWAVANGIINGRSNTGMLDPKGNASRVETAAIIQRFMTKIK